MKERPILFSAPMVKAILEDRKTMTRRVIKPQPTGWNETPSNDPAVWLWCVNGDQDWSEERKCPYGQPGTILWVKEAHYLWGHWVKNGLSKTGKQKYKFVTDKNKGVMFPDNPPLVICRGKEMEGWYKRPSIFMPYWACRIKREVTAVRAERVQDITEEDAIKEGIEPFTGINGSQKGAWVKDSIVIDRFARLWDSINGKTYPWESNLFVWVVEFKRS